MKALTRTIWLLSIISMFADVASEMLYPIIPIYLKTIGFSVVLIGILEGVAEATAGLSKGYFGRLSDQTGRRVPFVQIGYFLSNISKPMMVVFVYPFWVFMARTFDRMGKGIRTGARDAMLSDEATESTKGMVFGFHRSMDTLGAVIGPLLALLFLYYYPGQYKVIFLLSFIPGIFAILITFFLKESKHLVKNTTSQKRLFSFIHYWKESPILYRKVVVGFLVFALFNSSDFFLLLKATQAGLSDTWVIGIYVFYNLIYAIFSLPLGILADKIGLKKIFISGLLLFAIVYFGISISTSPYYFIAIFFLYGLFAAATEGISKAWISNITAKKDTATAIGTFAGFQSIATMLASSIAGIIWYNIGAAATFLVTACMTIIVVLYFIIFIPNTNRK
jgi:MFS family permease